MPARPIGMRTSALATALALTAGAAGCAAGSTAPQTSRTAVGVPATVATAGGATATQSTTTQPASAPTRTLIGVETVTVVDNLATVRLRPGRSLTVVLASNGAFSWHVPAAIGTAVRQVSASGGYPGNQPAQATFIAIQSGTATLQATDDTACLHAVPACLPPQRQWQLTVIVS